MAGRTSRPFLIRLAMWPCLIVGGLFLLTAVSTAVGCSDTSRLHGSPLGEWSVPFWVAQAAVLGGLIFVIGLGFKSEKVWGRRVVVAYWVVAITFSAIDAMASGVARGMYSFGLTSLIGLGIAVWYFFAKANVVAYYRELEELASGARA